MFGQFLWKIHVENAPDKVFKSPRHAHTHTNVYNFIWYNIPQIHITIGHAEGHTVEHRTPWWKHHGTPWRKYHFNWINFKWTSLLFIVMNWMQKYSKKKSNFTYSHSVWTFLPHWIIGESLGQEWLRMVTLLDFYSNPFPSVAHTAPHARPQLLLRIIPDTQIERILSFKVSNCPEISLLLRMFLLI